MKKAIIPTARQVTLYCEVCGLEDKYYMTNIEIYKKTPTTTYCSNCGKVTKKVPRSEDIRIKED